MSKHPDDDRTRLVSIREALAAANGDWQNIVALWSINADLTWLLERAEAAPATGLPAERPDITATPEEQGLTPGGAVEFMAADRALAVPHRDDDQPCGCDECMAYGAEDEGFDWYRVSPARRIVLRVLDSGDDRLAPVAVAFREHEDAVAETADQRETTPAGVLDEAALAPSTFSGGGSPAQSGRTGATSNGTTPAATTAAAADSLDAAWQAAEAALPEGWHIDELSWIGPGWEGQGGYEAHCEPCPGCGGPSAYGPTPAAALLALAVALGRSGSGEGRG